MRRILISLLIWIIALPAYAEIAYIVEKLPTWLHTGFAEGSAVTTTVEGGEKIEVLERIGNQVHVRSEHGKEGWIEAKYLTNLPPARPDLEEARIELAKLRKSLADAQAGIKQLETSIKEHEGRNTQLTKSLDNANALLAQLQAQANANQEKAAENAGFAWGWLILAFAMLGVGFGIGVVWLRERDRKRLGGMYLRI